MLVFVCSDGPVAAVVSSIKKACTESKVCACRESNPGHKHGRLVRCGYTTCALCFRVGAQVLWIQPLSARLSEHRLVRAVRRGRGDPGSTYAPRMLWSNIHLPRCSIHSVFGNMHIMPRRRCRGDLGFPLTRTVRGKSLVCVTRTNMFPQPR